MKVLVLDAPVDVDNGFDDPRLAHYASHDDQTTGLCGKRLRGVPAPPENPLCGICEVLADAHLRLMAERR